MSVRPAVTMQELELEHAELLPSRETLCCPKYGHASSSVTQFGYGNTIQSGGLINVAVGNGSLNNILSLGSGNL